MSGIQFDPISSEKESKCSGNRGQALSAQGAEFGTGEKVLEDAYFYKTHS